MFFLLFSMLGASFPPERAGDGGPLRRQRPNQQPQHLRESCLLALVAWLATELRGRAGFSGGATSWKRQSAAVWGACWRQRHPWWTGLEWEPRDGESWNHLLEATAGCR